MFLKIILESERKNLMHPYFIRSFLLLVGLVFSATLFAENVRRLHMYPRGLAMGDALVSLSGAESSIAYNPAGLYMGSGEWSMHLPSLMIAYNEIVAGAMSNEEGTTTNPKTTEDYEEFLGTRVWLDVQIGMPGFYSPAEGVYYGLSGELWVEMVFPEQPILPVVHLEYIRQVAVEAARAFPVSDTNFKLGFNAKIVRRMGFIADVSFLRLTADEDADMTETMADLENEYNPSPAPPRVVFDAGLIYEFKDPWKFSVGLSALDIGGVNHKGAGTVKQFNTIGVSAMPKSGEIDITLALDFQDFTYDYFSHNDTSKRLAFGAEFAVGKNQDHSHFLAFQVGIRSLQPSWGFTVNAGVLEFGLVTWTEDFGTESTERTDQRKMMFMALRW